MSEPTTAESGEPQNDAGCMEDPPPRDWASFDEGLRSGIAEQEERSNREAN